MLSPGDLYHVSKNKQADSVELYFYAKERPVMHKFWRKKDKAGASTQKVKFVVKTETASGKVRGSLVESISAVIGDELLAYRFMDAFIMQYNLPKILQKNAPFSLTYQKLYYNGEFIRYGEITRAALEINDKMVVRNFERLSRGGVFVTEKSFNDSRPFYAPVDYVRITSLYQPRRFHPIKKYRKAHQGIDFELPEGEPIYAVESGIIHKFGKQRGAGKYVVIRHAGGYESYYNHMSEIADLEFGQRIAAGTRIGSIGCTGYCTKPHLHFALTKNGQFINPIKLIKNYAYNQKREYKQLVADRD